MTRLGEDQQELKLGPKTKFKFSRIKYNCFKRRPTVKSFCGGEFRQALFCIVL